MMRHSTRAVLVILTLAVPARAQEPRVAVSAILGWTSSDGVVGQTAMAPDGNTYNRLDPAGAVSFGLDIGWFATPQVEVGFMYGRQMSTLQAGGTKTLDLGDLAIATYHGYVAYNFGASDGQIRPYIFGGLGMTRYRDVTTTVGGGQHTLSGPNCLSSTWGGGVKVFLKPKLGVQVGIDWTPTYIKSDAAGWWCDPWWGCYLVGHAQYANQLQFNGGVTFRF